MAALHVPGYAADSAVDLRHLGVCLDTVCKYVSGWIDRDIWEYAPVSVLSTISACTNGKLRIFTIPKLGEKLKQDLMPLTYTPRKFISHPYETIFYVIETDHRTYGPKAVARMLAEKVSFTYRDS